jgi:hypothetical protein
VTVPGPLDHSELRAVEDCLEAGDLTGAQQRLAQLGSAPFPAAGLSYLATRLLYLRGRLDCRSVAERMQELLREHPHFAEAVTLLGVANAEVAWSPTEPRTLGAPIGAVGLTSLVEGRQTPPPPSGPPLAGSHSKRPTYRPAQWPPQDLFDAPAAEDEHDRPTAVPEQTPLGDERKLVVDTRGTHPSARVDAPFSWPAPRSRREGTYSIGPNSAPPHGRSHPPHGTARGATSPPSTVPPSPPVQRVLGETGSVYARPDPRLPMAQAPEDRLQLSSTPPHSVPRPHTIPPAQRPLAELLDSGELWPPLEQQVARGDHAQAIAHFEESARHQLSHLPPVAPEHEHELLAQLAAELLHKSWVTHQFAPFDLSLQSLSRLQLAIATVYGTLPRERPASALFLLLGSYVGEALRTAHRGTWRRNGASPLLSTVRAGSSEWQPYDLVRGWLRTGAKRSLTEDLATTMAHPGSLAWQSRAQVKVIPHVLWHGDVEVQSLPGLGRALSGSVWSACCALLAEQALDLSLESLRAADWLLRLLTDSAQPLRGDEPWLQRLALLFGSYAGEVYRMHAPAAWLDSEEPGLERFLLQLGTGLTVSPMGLVITSAITRRAGAIDAWTHALIADPRRKPT